MKFKLFATACAALLISAGTSYAQCDDQLCLPDGTPVTCSVDPSGTKVWVDLNGNPVNTNTQGTGTFEVVQCDCATSTLSLTPRAFDIQSSSPTLGTIRTYLDPTRQAPLATRTANGDGTYTEDFYVYVNADVPGLGTLTGTTPLHFNSRRVTSFNPHREEQFNQVAPVQFADARGKVVLTLKATQIRLN